MDSSSVRGEARRKVEGHIRSRILSGEWPVGTRLPSEGQLARLCNVHRLTVNRAVSELVRERLVERRPGLGNFALAPQGSGASPSKDRVAGPAAQTGVSRNTVVLITSHAFNPQTNPYFGKIFWGLQSGLSENSNLYPLVLGTHEHAQTSPEGRARLFQPDVAAIVLLGSLPDAAVGSYLGTGVPCVHLAASESRAPVIRIFSDDRGGMREMVARVVAKGHRKIAHLNAERPVLMQDKLQGFLDGMKAARLTLPFELVKLAPSFEFEDSCVATREMIDQGLEFTALVCASDRFARAAIQVFREKGLAVPGDISVTGFDGSEEEGGVLPRITTMAVPLREMGLRTARVLARAQSQGFSTAEIALPDRFVEGDTLAEPGKEKRHAT